MKQKIKNLKDVPNCIEMYKQQGYFMAEENSDYLLFRKKNKILNYIGFIIIMFWIGVFMGFMWFGLLALVLYPIANYYDTIKVLK